MTETKLPPHPSRKNAALLGSVGAVGVLAAALLATDAGSRIGLAVGSGYFFWLAARIFRDGPTSQRVNMALDRLNRGLYEEAEAILEAIPPGRRANQLRRAIETQRSMLAFRRKDVDGAIAHATRAIEGRPSLLSLLAERLQILTARSLRAIAAAGKGDAAGAQADIAVVRTSPLATPGTLARASLAEAIVLSRENEREKLAALMTRDRKLLLEFTTPRDRALVRALQRTLYLPAGAAYREAARPEPQSESELASWISLVAPAAAGLASTGSTGTARALPTGSEDASGIAALSARGASAAVRKRGRKARGRVLALWVTLVVMFLAIWQFLSPVAPSGHVPAARAPVDSSLPLPSPYFYLVLFVGLVVVLNVLARRGLNRLTAATRLLALDDLGPAEAAFRTIAKGRSLIYGAQAESQLVAIAIRRARFEDALVLVDRAIARAAKNVALHDHVVPGLLSQRAYLLAALDRPDEALTELATLAAAHPTYPQLAVAQLLTRTVLAVRRGDIETASALASQRTPDFGMGLYDELLADVLTATTEGRPVKVEVERLRGDLRADPELRTWLGVVWPGGEAALEGAKARAA